jgi:fucose 4-O-acetylase-like acetyltransferase
MCLGLIALLPVLSGLDLHNAPIDAIGRDSLFFYLWHPLVMGSVMLTGIGPLATLALSILLLAVASRFAAQRPVAALLLGTDPARSRPTRAKTAPAIAG